MWEYKLYFASFRLKKMAFNRYKVVRGIGGGCDEEAVRVLKNSKMEPGVQKTEECVCILHHPIFFQLQQ
jgi:hypothetical protein